MEIDITLKGYRCFGWEQPASFRLQPGITSIVGINNSGKSAFLRHFWELRELYRHYSDPFSFMQGLNPELKATGSFSLPHSRTDDRTSIVSNRSLCGAAILVQSRLESSKLPSFGRDGIEIKIEPDGASFNAKYLNKDLVHHTPTQSAYRDIESPYIVGANGVRFFSDGMPEAFQILADTMYIPAHRYATTHMGGRDCDVQVGKQFCALWSRFKSGGGRKANDHAIRLTRNIERILGFKRLDINVADSEQAILLEIDDHSYRLEDVGSGVAQLIIVLCTAALSRPAYILIDEPESNLHPSLQIDFIRTLRSYAKEGLVFATHNMGLARASSNHIYATRVLESGESTLKPYAEEINLIELAGALSYSGYQQLGHNTILLVEGPTELLVIQQFLRLYEKDHQVVLLPCFGRGLINAKRHEHLVELRRLCPNVKALVDSERSCENGPVEGTRIDFKAACDKAGIPCHLLERRAIENYFTGRALKRALGQEYEPLGPYESLKGRKGSWHKSRNSEIAREMTLDDLKDTDLGDFLSKCDRPAKTS